MQFAMQFSAIGMSPTSLGPHNFPHPQRSTATVLLPKSTSCDESGRGQVPNRPTAWAPRSGSQVPAPAVGALQLVVNDSPTGVVLQGLDDVLPRHLLLANGN